MRRWHFSHSKPRPTRLRSKITVSRPFLNSMLIPRTRNPCIPSSFVKQLGRIWWDLPSVYLVLNAGRISYQMLLFLQLTFTIIRHEPIKVTLAVRNERIKNPCGFTTLPLPLSHHYVDY